MTATELYVNLTPYLVPVGVLGTIFAFTAGFHIASIGGK